MSLLVGVSTLYQYSQGVLIQAIVRAGNVKGYGSYSSPNTAGILAQVAPLAPTSGPYRGSLTTET